MKKLLLLVAVMSFSISAFATHAYGGEITWKCFSSGPNAGKFKFYMTLYRDCGSGTASLPTSVVINSNSPAGTISLSQVGTNTDVSPSCYITPSPIKCNTVSSGQGALEEAKFESGYINLNGTPPATGWIFSYSLCCRPNTITNLVNAGSSNLYLEAVMYPYSLNGVSQNTNSCYDSSPRFLESPKTAICTGYKHIYGQLSFDNDLDSLTYSWAPVLGNNGSAVAYSSSYSFINPLPNDSVAAQLNGLTGNVTVYPTTGGSFATSVKVESYRCGQKISEVYREVPIVIRNNCSTLPTGQLNGAPSLSISNIPGYQGVTPVVINGDTAYYEASVFAGQQVRFRVVAQDPQLLPNFLPQTVTFQAVGGQLGSPLSNSTTGCDAPPCATVAPVAPQTSLSNPLNNEAQFNWQTSCNHVSSVGLSCGSPSTQYNFNLRMQDNFCPIPAYRLRAVVVNVFSTIAVPPDMSSGCVTTGANGALTISWGFPADTGMNFDSYIIYHATSKSGPYTVLDTIVNYSQLSYLHNAAVTGANYYFLRIRGGCNSLSVPSDTLGNHFFQLQPQNANSTPSSPAYFNCTSTDSTATYQWQESNGTSWSSLSSQGVYSGTTSDSLVISSVTLGMNNYSYRCVVATCTNDTSDASVLTVTCPDSLTTQPQNFTAYSSNGWANFKCESSDTAATYQWQQSNGAGWLDLTNLGNYSGATSDSLVIIGVTSTMNNYGFRCIVTGCTTDTSDVAVLTVANGIGLGESTPEKLTISPNPTNGLVSLNAVVLGTYELLSLDGRILESGTAKKDYDLTKYPKGVYHLRLSTDEGTRVLKVVKN